MQSLITSGLLLFAVFLFGQTNVVESQNIVYCYWGTWSHYRPGNGKFEVSSIDPNLCTHIGYAFFGLGGDDRIKSLDTWLDDDLKNIANTIALKQQNPSLKVLASIGGWNEGSSKYSAMASHPSRRATFIASVMQFLQKYGFDGLDLDWEYPAQRGGSANDRVNFVALLSELNASLKSRGLLLTIAVGAAQQSASISYDIPNVSKNVDLINVMTYDFSGAWERTVGFNAPLQGSGNNNVKAAISYWLQSGAPANKLVMGLAVYGRSFTLANSANNSPGAAATGGGTAGPFTREAGFLGYNEICEKLKSGWTRRFDNTHLVPFAFNGNQWVGYDDKESLNHKIAYLKSLNLAGAMVWSIETDDFRGTCGEKYPLLKTIKSGISGGEITTTRATPAPPTSVITTRPPVPPTSRPNTGICQGDGKFVDPTDCSRFYECSGGRRFEFACPAGLHFDQAIGVCNWPDAVNCHP